MDLKLLTIRVAIVLIWGILFSISQYAMKRFMTELPGLLPTQENILFILRCKWFYITGTIFPASVLLSSLSYRFMHVSSAGPVFFTFGAVISLFVGPTASLKPSP
jgi:hypothetical protein